MSTRSKNRLPFPDTIGRRDDDRLERLDQVFPGSFSPSPLPSASHTSHRNSEIHKKKEKRPPGNLGLATRRMIEVTT